MNQTGKKRLAIVSSYSESCGNAAFTRVLHDTIEQYSDFDVEVVELDLLPRIDNDGESVVVPYTNFYIANGALIVPVSGTDPDMDAQALELLGRLYPDREAIGIDGRTLALGGGGIHCITQQIPAA